MAGWYEFTNVSEDCTAFSIRVEAVQSSETLVNSHRSTRRYNTEDLHLHTHRLENLISHSASVACGLPLIAVTSPNSLFLSFSVSFATRKIDTELDLLIMEAGGSHSVSCQHRKGRVNTVIVVTTKPVFLVCFSACSRHKYSHIRSICV
jgi:hypothetical protein